MPQPPPAVPADFVLTGVSRLVTVAPATAGASGPLGVIERGALAARDGTIVWVGLEAQLASAVDLAAVPRGSHHGAGGRAVLPGFVDSHTHFVFAGDRAEEFQLRHCGRLLRRAGASGTRHPQHGTRDPRGERRRATSLGRERLRSFAAHGTTTVEGKTGYGLDSADARRVAWT